MKLCGLYQHAFTSIAKRCQIIMYRKFKVNSFECCQRCVSGMKLISMREFLEKEGITGGLRGMYPPAYRAEIWGRLELWPYLDAVSLRLYRNLYLSNYTSILCVVFTR